MFELLAVLVLVAVAGAAWLFYFFMLESMYAERLHTTEKYTVTTKDLWKLRLCRYRTGRTEGEPLLLVHGFCSNSTVFVEPPKESMVAYLASKGFDCWTVDLRGTRSSQPPFGADLNNIGVADYIEKDLPVVIKHIQKITMYKQVHWVGHSLGGVLLYAYAQEYGTQDIASGITMASPVGRVDVPLKIPVWALKLAYWLPSVPAYLLRAYVPLGMKRGFGPLIPANLSNLAKEVGAHQFFNMVERFSPRSLEEMLALCTQPQWSWKPGANFAEGLSTLDLPLLVFCGARDVMLTPSRAKGFVDALPVRDKDLRVLSVSSGCSADYGHAEIPFARNAAKEVYDPIVEWVNAHPAQLGVSYETEEGAGPEILVPLASSERSALLSRVFEAPDPSTAPEAEPAAPAPQTAKRAAATKSQPKNTAAKPPAKAASKPAKPAEKTSARSAAKTAAKSKK